MWTEADIQEREARMAMPQTQLRPPLPSIKSSRARGIAPPEDRTYNGRLYHSKLEATWAAKLDLWKKAGRVSLVEPQVRMPIIVNGHKICCVVVDFGVTYSDGSYELLECKGHETDVWKLKAKLLKACYPQHRYVIVK